MNKTKSSAALLPLFLSVIFLNAFVDLGHKIIIQNTVFKIFNGDMLIILTSIVNGLILLPFLFLFSTSGFLADKFSKPKIMQRSAMAAIFITLGITACYYQGWYVAAFGFTFILAAQSAIYAPAKYGYIKEFMGEKSLSKGNGYVQAVTIIAILLSTVIFSVWFESALAGKTYTSPETLLPYVAYLGWVLVGLSVLEYILSLGLKDTRSHTQNQGLQLDTHKLFKGNYLKENLKELRANKIIWISVLGLSAFWAVSQLVLASFPAYAKDQLGINNTEIVQGIMACTGIGIIIGSILSSRNANNRIRKEFLVWGSLGLVVTLFLLPTTQSVAGLVVLFITLGTAAGMILVPLNATIQKEAPSKKLGTIIAGNNWVQTVAMVLVLIITATAAYYGANSIGLFYFAAIVVTLGLGYTLKQYFGLWRRVFLSLLITLRYDLETHNVKSIPKEGGVLLLGNHISFLDWLFIQLASPRPVRFIMHASFYKSKIGKWFFDLFKVIPIQPGKSKAALVAAQQALKDGDVVCIFPEGGITYTGQLNSLKSGYQKIIENTGAVLIPFYLHGMWGSRFSRAEKNFSKRNRPLLKRKIEFVFGSPIPSDSDTAVVKNAIRSCSVVAFNMESSRSETIDRLWIEAIKKHPLKECLQDTIGDPLSSARALTGSVLFSRLIKKYNRKRNVGLLLPTASANAIVTMATWLQGKTAVQLNYTASTEALIKAIASAEIDNIFTSRKFLTKLTQKGIILDTVLAKVNVFYLEDLKEEISTLRKLSTLLAVKFLPATLLKILFSKRRGSNDIASILFSSGSEGTPKGVVISHHGLISNVNQAAQLLTLNDQDKFMANLPLFHAFGLTVTSVLPLLKGMPVICHPDPTDGFAIAKAIAQHNITFYCSTPTFLNLLSKNRKVNGTMLESLRYVISGAEKLQDHVRQTFTQKFGKKILEGYGATETGPIASVNMPDHLSKKDLEVQIGTKEKTVGMAVPGTNIIIADPETYQPLPTGEAGMILISGAQLMQGYLNDTEKTKQALVTYNDVTWYVTGDKGITDENGFIQIVDRYSRFAKIGGEMVSLGAVESAIQEIIAETEIELSAVNMPDKNKGEHIILMFTGDVGIEDIQETIRQSKLSPLMKPKSIHKVEEIPKLGTGKSDFTAIKKLAKKIAQKI